MVKAVDLHFVENLQRVRQRLRHIAENLVHLGTRLKPLLLRVEHARRVVEVLASGQAEQVIVGLSIFLVDEMSVVGTDEFDAILASQLDEHPIGLLLQGECLAIGPHIGVFHLVALQLQIVVVAEDALMPFDGLAGTGDITLQNLVWHFASNTGRAHDESFVEAFQVGTVGAWTHVETVDPRTRDELNQVLVALIVLRQHDEVVAALVFLAVLLLLRSVLGNIHFATENRLEGFQAFALALFVDADAIIMKLLDAKHVAMIGDGHASHAIVDGLVDQLRYLRLSVEDGEISMYV